MSIAVVAMTDSSSTNPKIPIYDWKNTNIILSSFYWTYIVLQLFSGYIFKKFGLRRVLLVSMFINSSAFTLVPLCSSLFGSSGVIGVRMIQGLFQGFTFPACHAVLGLWAPINERSQLTILLYSGGNVGVILALLITGYLAASWYGWPIVFYIFGACGITWCIVWFILGYDTPSEHPWISETERIYIEESLEQTQKNDIDIPWKAILTSFPFWVLITSNMGNAWGLNIITLDLPTFLSKGLGLNISSNGLISASPQMVQLVLIIVAAPIGDYIVNRKIVSLMNCRRIFQFCATILPSLALVWLAFVSKTQIALAVFLLNIIMGLSGLLMHGSYINHIDLSPTYGGLLLGVENAFSEVLAITGPIFVQWFLTDMTNIILWHVKIHNIFHSLLLILFTYINIYSYKRINVQLIHYINFLIELFLVISLKE
ncbi:hypothetical protein GWI33_020422 [Rhynchophorus ferrugineus]|uniref:Major facilitator superfamily (MFS) profile domain-containing protein n=1 Tax=Rhynchophorus ferrugineus TaxID=354439 RepID=A0A834HPI3_RHYFE|nr:hypothetical protein GWI33_020422 [Rhynchophorus ferrugineus]